jgi:tRNA pseudouridine38-40 synthase
MSVVLRVAYDGTDFQGFARQAADQRRADGLPVRTVQGALEAALAELYKGPVLTRGASRTDAGVHAHGQLVAFEPPRAIPPRGLLYGLAGLLPPDVVATAAWEASGPGGGPLDIRGCHRGKHYRYRLRAAKLWDPHARRDHWLLDGPLDVARMRAAAARFVGTHDFASFRAAGCQAKTTERTMHAVDIVAHEQPNGGVATDPGRAAPTAQVLDIHVHGDAFLQHMVRIMVGTLVDVGAGRRTPESIETLLRIPDRRAAGQTAPPQGLCLMEVKWCPPGDGDPRADPG